MSRRSLVSRPGDAAMVAFFVLHIPITILMGTQLALPEWTKAVFPAAIIQAAQGYARDSNDYLIQERQLWL
ncbi:hypothetical protein HK100_004887, partial [Physocladia obscura]